MKEEIHLEYLQLKQILKTEINAHIVNYQMGYPL